jgi:hypothetical protein
VVNPITLPAAVVEALVQLPARLARAMVARIIEMSGPFERVVNRLRRD